MDLDSFVEEGIGQWFGEDFGSFHLLLRCRMQHEWLIGDQQGTQDKIHKGIAGGYTSVGSESNHDCNHTNQDGKPSIGMGIDMIEIKTKHIVCADFHLNRRSLLFFHRISLSKVTIHKWVGSTFPKSILLIKTSTV